MYEKFYVHEIAAVDLSKIYFLKNAIKTCKPNDTRFLSRKILSLFRRPSTQVLTLGIKLEECKQLPDFPVMPKSTLRNWCRKLEFCYKRGQKNNNDASESMRMLRIETCNSITKVAPAQVFSCKYCEIFYPS